MSYEELKEQPLELLSENSGCRRPDILDESEGVSLAQQSALYEGRITGMAEEITRLREALRETMQERDKLKSDFHDYARYGVRPDELVIECDRIHAQFLDMNTTIDDLTQERDRMRAALAGAAVSYPSPQEGEWVEADAMRDMEVKLAAKDAEIARLKEDADYVQNVRAEIDMLRKAVGQAVQDRDAMRIRVASLQRALKIAMDALREVQRTEIRIHAPSPVDRALAAIAQELGSQ